ncbi:MAG: isoprenylcysteine carboxylmethyltransferase family protein [Chloroflexi bacterium]|nr:isoprenylcysteine carboxylmethyltransferase family protein [Chloroflexota bacterium]
MNANVPSQHEMSSEVKRGIIAIIVKGIFGAIFIAALLMLTAGRWDWVWGWVMVVIFVIAATMQVLLLLPTNPALLAERSKGLREKGAPLWDQIITSFAVGFLPIASWIVAALHVRFDWSPMMPLALHIAGAIVFALGWVLILWATYSNRFFTTTVRIQKDHAVQTGGPYRFVRHPGYVAAIVYSLATPFLLGSWWALIPMIFVPPLMILRTALEDKLLQDQLAGYKEYAARVRYRLVPGVW